MSLKDFDQTLILGAVLFQALELVAAGAEGTGGRVLEGGNGLGAFFTGVDQFFAQGTDDAVVASVDLANVFLVLASGFDHTAGAGINNSGDTARLSVESVLFSHYRSCLLAEG